MLLQFTWNYWQPRVTCNCARGEKTHAASRITAHASLNTNKHTQTITRVQNDINLPCRTSACVASDDIPAATWQQCMQSTHTHTHACTLLHRLFSIAAQLSCDWQIEWPAHCSVSLFNGQTWQVEIGKMRSPLLSPLSWTKDPTCLFNGKEMARGGAQDVQEAEWLAWSVR